ncbi:MAG TPA: cytochrome bc complex cytochrome b subunit [Trebonia sp.]
MPPADVPRIPGAVTGLGGWLDDRFGGARGVRTLMRKVFPDHWTFMLGEVALWSFVILILTGTYLALFFQPSMAPVVYHGSYTKLDGITMSQAYESTLNISFDVRGGLLMRQIHHWAANLFLIAISAHMLRHFFLGSYRKPRDVNWLIGIVIFAFALIEGLFGYSLPDDQLSGAGLRIFQGVLQGIPIIGTYTGFFLFGGEFPGTDIVPRMYILHVLIIPGLILALVTAHVFISFHQKHTAMPALGNSERAVRGQPFWPYFLVKGTAWFFFIFGALAVLATFAQINPIWLYGPYSPLAISSASQPDWYLGILEGALRAMPAWEINFLGHTLSMSVLIPFALPLGIILGGAAVWPFFERWVTGDKAVHHINDRPRNAPARTGIGVAVIVFYGVLWAEGANDVLADHFHVPLYTVTWIARVLVIVGPIAAYVITKRVCLGLQRKDARTLEHGVETGMVRQLPSGEFIEEERPVTDEERAVLAARSAVPALPAPHDNGVPAPGRAGVLARFRIELNTAYTESAGVTAAVSGQATGDERDQVADREELPAGESHREVPSHTSGER